MKFLEVSDIDCYYGAKKVLEKVNFSVDKGEFFGVIGPNGSGKTTLLRCISGVLRQRSGVLRVNGLNVHTLGEKEIAKNIAVVPQAPVISFSFTALEIVMMGRNPHISRFRMENEKDYKIAENAMELTHVKHLASRSIDTLSGGELQRVIIARALAQEPKLLLLDEPTVHLDISHQLEIMELIRKLNRNKEITVVAVFHDLNLAAQYCNRLMLLDSGKVSSIGTPHNVLTPENIRKTYHVDVLVKEHPLSSSLYVIPFSPAVQRLTSGQKSVHIICGGGSGVQLMKVLHGKRYNVTVGVLNVLDSDYEVAVALGIPTVEEAPFSRITDETYERNLELILNSDMVVVANAFFGEGNLLNLKATKTALDHHIPVILVESTPFSERNFAGREGEKLYNSIRERAKLVQRPEDVRRVIG